MAVSVGGKVKVGSGVPEGCGVNVSVEVKVGCSVAVSVGEGSGLIVQVGSMGVGAGPMSVVNAPHPIEKNVIVRMTNVQRNVLSLSKGGNLMNGEMGAGSGDCFGLTPWQ